MKRVSFEIAKAIKEAGYPQENNCIYYSEIGDLITISGSTNLDFSTDFIAAPYALEVWLWLWREKKISVGINCDEDSRLEKHWSTTAEELTGEIGAFTDEVFFSDPEEAIIAAIQYLVDNNLIK